MKDHGVYTFSVQQSKKNRMVSSFSGYSSPRRIEWLFFLDSLTVKVKALQAFERELHAQLHRIISQNTGVNINHVMYILHYKTLIYNCLLFVLSAQDQDHALNVMYHCGAAIFEFSCLKTPWLKKRLI
jgi:hypothetical protein